MSTTSMSITLKGAKKVTRFLKRADVHVEKSLNTAIRVEGFRLKKLLQQEIRSGRPGGRKFAPLSDIAKRLRGRSQNRNPLKRLALGIRYQVTKGGMAIGWVGPKTGFDARRAIEGSRFGRGISEGHHVSKSWRRLAKLQQEGFNRLISPAQRRMIVAKGGTLGKVEGGNTPFFLKQTTRFFKTPSRQIISPFWLVHKQQAKRNIKRNFRLKLKGQRI